MKPFYVQRDRLSTGQRMRDDIDARQKFYGVYL